MRAVLPCRHAAALLASLLAGSAGCAKPSAEPAGSSAGSTEAAATVRAAPSTSAAAGVAAQEEPFVFSPPALASAADPAAGLPPPAAEARRVSLRRLDEMRALVPHEALLREHFGGALPSPLELQATALAGDHRALLLYGEPRRRNPLLLVTGAQGELLWTKERPLAGTRQVVTEMVVAPGPHGEVALLWCDIPTQIVGLRKWSATGLVLADFEVLEVDVCEALSALYWPGRGWVAVASQHGAARAQLLDELGKRAWGSRGNELPWTARPSSPASVAIDSDTSAIVFQVGDLRRGEGVTPDRVLAMRFDTLGTALWEQPLDLGPAPPGQGARIAPTRFEPGKVRVALGSRGTATVTSAGAILGAR
jgi:hypothetical protein